MGLIENEVQLPGSLTEVTSQYSYGYDTSQFGTTESAVIIGTSFHGPTGAPVPIYNPEHAEYMFGKGYDPVTKKEATLVPAIKDAYEKGCRTIYAVRVSGEDVVKDYEFSVDSSLRLRIKSAFPTNDAKDFFLTYDNREGQESVSFYKPASRATVVERRLGIVESTNDVLINKIDLSSDYSMNKDTDLLSVMNLINNHTYNNVIRLSIVDENGIEVTNTSEEARRLTLGALLPGLYTMGRSSSNCTPVTNIDYRLCLEKEDKPFSSFDGVVYKSIILNTDVSSEFPIYAQDIKVMKEILNEVSIFIKDDQFSYLETQGQADRAFAKDNVDYEEVDISNFELYQKLGSGFAITAYAERRVKKDANGNVVKELTPRIRETPFSDNNRIKEMRGGIYSILENLGVDYRVLAGVGADEEIKDSIPRAKDFQVVTPVGADIFGGLIKATPIIDEDDIDNDYVKNYRFEIHELEEEDVFEGDIEDVYTEKVMEVLPLLTYATPEELKEITKMNIENGTRTLVRDALTGKINLFIYDVVNGYRKFASKLLEGQMVISNGKIYKGVLDAGAVNFEEMTISPDGLEIEGEFWQYILGENNSHVYVFEVLAANLTPTVYVGSAVAVGDVVVPLGDVETMFSENEEKTIVYAQSNYFEQNDVIVRSAYMDNLTVEELVEMLNNHSALNHIFKFSLTDKGSEFKDDYLSEIAETHAPDITNADGSVSIVLFHEVVELPEDREVVYNYSTYIPYKTSDNFARHLAQHAKYTSLKTAPTHGIIGFSILNDTSLKGISKRVDELLKLDFDMYVKNYAGKSVLGSDGLPYPVGNEVSIIETQNTFVDEDSTRYILNGASAYTGMVTQLPKDQSSTNQPIDIGSVNYTYSNYQLGRLTQAGFVTVKDTITKGLVITDGVTMGPVEDPRRRLAVTRIMNEVQRVIRAASEPFIGKPNNDSNRNSLKTAIKSELEALKGILIDSYEFMINTDRSIQKYSYIDVDYAIRPVYEIREVRHRITIKDEI